MCHFPCSETITGTLFTCHELGSKTVIYPQNVWVAEYPIVARRVVCTVSCCLFVDVHVLGVDGLSPACPAVSGYCQTGSEQPQGKASTSS